ncbi:unnamed protein product, partial [Closterium sp. NIES-54]
MPYDFSSPILAVRHPMQAAPPNHQITPIDRVPLPIARIGSSKSNSCSHRTLVRSPASLRLSHDPFAAGALKIDVEVVVEATAVTVKLMRADSHPLGFPTFACYASPATAALSRLILPYLFPDLAAFPTVADLITHLRTSDTRYRAALPADQGPLLSVCPTTLTVDLLEQRLLAAETSRVAVGASHGDPRTPVFEGCSPSPLLPSVAFAAAADLGGFESVGAASAPSGRRRPGRSKGGRGTRGTGGGGGGSGGGSGGGWAVEAEEAVAVAAGAAEEVAEAAEAAVELVADLRRGVAPVVFSASSSSAVVRPHPPSSFVSGTLDVSECGGLHSTQRCFGRLMDAWRHQFPDATEIPRWGDLSRAGVAVFDLDYDAILAAMYAVSTSDEGDCYLCLPPDPGGGAAAALGACEIAALGASTAAAPGAGESALSGTASAQVFHTFTLDSGASRSFFRDRTTLTPLSRPVAVSLADPFGGPVLASFSTVLPCPVAPSGTLSGLYLPSFSTNLVSGADLQDHGVDQFTPASQRVTHCTCARTGRHLATFTRRPGSSLYTLSTTSPPIPTFGQVAASSQVFAAASGSGPESAPCSCRLLSHQTLLWHHHLGHPSLPRLGGMASRVLVSGLPRSLLPLPPGPTPTCIPCVEGRQRAAPHSSEFPPTEAPLQTLHMDVWGPARVRGRGHERYFLLVVDDYSRYTTVFPLRSKGDVTEVHFSDVTSETAAFEPPHSPPCDSGELRPLRPSPSGASVSSLPGPFWSLFLCPPVRHPSLPRLRGMASRVLVSGLPRSLPPLPPGPAPTCVPCVEGRQRAAPHSSEFPPTEAPLQTLHMDVWGPARVRGQGHERYFLLVVDDYSRYTTVFPLRSKGDVTE